AGVLVAFLPLAGLGLLLSSDLVARWRELSGERMRRIREEQRAEMAAHLHDSVLQTLALIQNRGGASSEVARLARAQ
ncbi:histidine kinase, partial [Streptomyces brasiliscabiei]